MRSCFIGVVLTLSVVFAPPTAAQQSDELKPRIDDFSAERVGDRVSVSYRLSGCLPPESLERIHSGIPIRFRHKVEIIEDPSGFFDSAKVAARAIVEASVEYDSLTQSYQLTRNVELHSRRKRQTPPPLTTGSVTSSEDEMAEWMIGVEGLELYDPARPMGRDELRARVEVALGRKWFLFIFPATLKVSAEVQLDGAN